MKSQHSKTLLGGMIFLHHRTTFMFRRWVPVFSHAGPGGRLLLKEDVSWRNINGFALNTPWWCVWVKFRRFR